MLPIGMSEKLLLKVKGFMENIDNTDILKVVLFIEQHKNDQQLKDAMLFYSLFYEHNEITKQLIHLGASVQSKDGYGWSLLHTYIYATLNTDLEVIKLLIERGLNVDSPWGGSPSTPLQWAIDTGKIEVAKLLIELGADTELMDDLGQTALDIAVKKNNHIIVEMVKSMKQLS